MTSPDPQSPSPEEVQAALQAFLNAQTWVESWYLVTNHQALLLSPFAAGLFEHLEEQYAGQEDVLEAVRVRRELLERVRAEGVQAAYADLLTPEYLAQLLDELPHLQGEAQRPRRQAVLRAAIALTDPEADPALLAGLRAELGLDLLYGPAADPGQALEEARLHLLAALEFFGPEDQPEVYARLHIALSVLYPRRTAGDRAENFDQALAHLERLLVVHTREANPQEWARTQHNLGETLRTHPGPGRVAHLERAIEHFHQALTVFTAEAFPYDHGLAQNSLGGAYVELEGAARQEPAPGTAKGARVERALEHLHGAEAALSRSQYPENWAKVQINLGSACLARVQGERADNLERARAHLLAAEEVFDARTAPYFHAVVHFHLAQLYLERRAGDRADNLEDAIASGQAALEVMTRESFPDYHATLQGVLGRAYAARQRGDPEENLARSQQHLWASGGDPAGAAGRSPLQQGLEYADRMLAAEDPEARQDFFERALASYEEALQAYPRDARPTDWALTHLATANLYHGLDPEGRPEILDREIEHWRLALEVYTPEAQPREWATAHTMLGSAYRSREAEGDLERAIEAYQAALRVYTPADHPHEWADAHENLADLSYRRSEGTRDDNLAASTGHYRAAQQVYTREAHPEDWARLQGYVGVNHFELRGGDRAENLETARACLEEALEVWTRERSPTEWAKWQHNLGNVYSERAGGDRAENLERAIECLEGALEVSREEGEREPIAATLNSLGGAYSLRVRGDRADNLERSLDCFRQALETYRREDHPEDWAMAQHNLGNAWMQRPLGERADNVEAAIECYRQALEVRRRENLPFYWAMTQGSLGIAYSERERGDRGQNLGAAVACYEQALQVVTPSAFPALWASTQVQLGNVYLDLHERGEPEALERAVDCLQAALEVYTRADYPDLWATVQHNLGQALRKQFERAPDGDLEPARAAMERALEVYTLEAHPFRRQRTLLNLGNLYRAAGRWQEAQAAWAEAIEAGEAVLAAAYTEPGKRAEIRAAGDLYYVAAYAALKAGDPGRALVFLDRGRARLLNEALAQDDADLSVLPDAQRRELLEARRQLRALQAEMRLAPGEPGRRDDLALGEALQEAQARMRARLGAVRAAHPDFMAGGLDLPELLAEIPPGGALVVPLITAEESFVFVVPHGVDRVTPDHVLALDAEKAGRLVDLVVGAGDEPGWMARYLAWQRGGSLSDWQATVDRFTGQAWELLMGAVHARLAALGMAEGAPVVLMPQRVLGMLPLHAAWREQAGARRYFGDEFTVTYAPGGALLRVSRRRLAERRSGPDSLLAVENPTGDLFYAALECAAVAGLFDPDDVRRLSGEAASQDAVVEAARGRAYLHFACHGYYHWRDVMRSALLLAGDDPFELAEVVAPGFDLSASRLVVLSACETGLLELAETPDEYLGLPAGFLQAGAPAVVSTLWAVNDLSTALLMAVFYRLHREKELPPAEALRAAQYWLREATAEKLALAGHYEGLYEASGRRDADAFRWMRYYQTHPDARPFRSPYYWAGFVFSGASG